MIRIAAVADVHFGTESAGSFKSHLQHLAERADMLLLAGDLTRHGEVDEARVLADELRSVDLPKLAVLGNHDYHADQQDAITEVMEAARVQVLEGESTHLQVNGATVGIAGVKGFGGGFAGASGTDFGEPEMKAFIRHTKAMAAQLQEVLEQLRTDLRLALLHYSPVEETLIGERLEIFPFLGSYLLAEAVDTAGADLVVHGHAHAGSERGETPGGIPVRNVSLPVIKRAYSLFRFESAPVSGKGSSRRTTPHVFSEVGY